MLPLILFSLNLPGDVNPDPDPGDGGDGAYFGPSYFAPGYFGDSYFGTGAAPVIVRKPRRVLAVVVPSAGRGRYNPAETTVEDS